MVLFGKRTLKTLSSKTSAADAKSTAQNTKTEQPTYQDNPAADDPALRESYHAVGIEVQLAAEDKSDTTQEEQKSDQPSLQQPRPRAAARRGSVERQAARKDRWHKTVDRLRECLPSETKSTVEDTQKMPFLLRECNALQLVERYLTTTTSNAMQEEMKESLRKTALKMVEQLAQTKVIEKQHLADVVPLGLFPESDVVKKLLEALIEKMAETQSLNLDVLNAITQVVRYAHLNLSANDVLTSLDVIADKLAAVKVQESSILEQGLASLNGLLDATLLLEVRKLDEKKLDKVQKCLGSLKPKTPSDQVAHTYAQQALLRVTLQKTDWEAGLSASYSIVKGVLQMSFAVVEKSPTALIDAAIGLYQDAGKLKGALKGKMQPWFGMVSPLKILARQDFGKFLDCLNALNHPGAKSWKMFSSGTEKKLPEALLITLIPVLDDIIRDKKDKRNVKDPERGNCPVRESALHLLGKFYIDEVSYGCSDGVRELVLSKLYRYCGIPEVGLQRVAKQVAKVVYEYAHEHTSRSASKQMSRKAAESAEQVAQARKNAAHPSHYWFSETMLLEQAANPHFEYDHETLGRPHSERVAEAFKSSDPLAYLIEGMHHRAYQFVQTTLKEDLDTYVPVKTSQPKTGNEPKSNALDLGDSICDFLEDDASQVLLIHGNAGSGKTLLGRYLESALWHIHEEGTGVVPIFIPLPAIKHPVGDMIREPLLEAGFTTAQIQALRQNKDLSFLFILDGFDEISVKANLYRTNEFAQWPGKVIITSRTEYLQALGDYHGYFTASDQQRNVMERYIRPFDVSQQTSFFKKWISKGLSQWNSAESYQKAIEDIPGLSALITTPFMLRMVAQVLPTLKEAEEARVQQAQEEQESTKLAETKSAAEEEGKQHDATTPSETTSRASSEITRAKVYQVFMNKTFLQAKERLHMLVNQAGSQIPRLPEDFDELSSFQKYSMDLAANMFVSRQNSVQIRGGDYRLPYELTREWDRFFGEELSQRCAREGAPLVPIGRQRAFRHKSLLEYFAAMMLTEELHEVMRSQATETATTNETWASSVLHYFNRRSVHEEAGVLDFMLEMLQMEPALEDMLWQIVMRSKTDQTIAIAAGNALTLLVALSVKRKCSVVDTEEKRNLSGIYSQGAVLDNGDFRNTNFAGATFTDTSWDGACVDEADFTGAKFNNNLIEECAALTGPTGPIYENQVLPAYDQALADTLSGLYIWSLSEGGECIDHSPEITYWNQCAVSPNGRWMAICTDKTLALWDAQAKNWAKQRLTAGAKAVGLSDEMMFWVSEDQKTLHSCALATPENEEKVTFSPFNSRELQQFYSITYSAAQDQWWVFWQDHLNWETLSVSAYNAKTYTLKTNLDRRLEYKALWPLGDAQLLVQDRGQRLSYLDCTTLLPVKISGPENAEDCCISPSGRLVLTKQGEKVSVWQRVPNESGETQASEAARFKLQWLYAVEGGAGALGIHCFSPDERVIALGKSTEVVLYKAEEETRLQVIKLNAGQEVETVSFASGGKLLVLRVKNELGLLRYRVELDDQLEEQLGNKETSQTQTLSAFGAKFLDIKDEDWTAEDRALFLERGGILESEVDLINGYKAARKANKSRPSSEREETQSWVEKALRYRCVEFCKQMRWDPRGNSRQEQSYVQVLYQNQRRDGYYDDFVRQLDEMGKGLPLNKPDEGGVTALQFVARKGYVQSVRTLLALGAEVNLGNKNGVTSLWIASQNGHEAVCRLLLAQGAAVDEKVAEGYTPLSIASAKGHEAVCRLLLAQGAAVDEKDKNGATPLWIASRNGHETVCRLLLAQGAAVDEKDKDRATPLFIASLNGHEAVCRLLLAQGAAVDEKREGGYTPLHIASANGHEEVCSLLLEQGAAVDMRNKNGATPLYMASANGHEAACRLLLAQGAAVDEKNEDGETLLIIASGRGHEAVCRLLLAQGAAVDEKEENGCTPLHVASGGGHEAVCRLLLAQEAAVDEKEENGCTPLHVASGGGHEAVCRLLLAQGAAVDEKDKHGSTPLSIASEGGYDVICHLLFEYGAVAVNEKDGDGDTPLSMASRGGYELICQLLLNRGANALLEGGKGKPLECAQTAGHTKVVALLESHLKAYPEGVGPIQSLDMVTVNQSDDKKEVGEAMSSESVSSTHISSAQAEEMISSEAEKQAEAVKEGIKPVEALEEATTLTTREATPPPFWNEDDYSDVSSEGEDEQTPLDVNVTDKPSISEDIAASPPNQDMSQMLMLLMNSNQQILQKLGTLSDRVNQLEEKTIAFFENTASPADSSRENSTRSPSSQSNAQDVRRSGSSSGPEFFSPAESSSEAESRLNDKPQQSEQKKVEGP